MLGIDWTSTDFVNNIDDAFDRITFGSAFITFALFSIIDQTLKIVLQRPEEILVAQIIVLIVALYFFAYWGKVRSTVIGAMEATSD